MKLRLLLLTLTIFISVFGLVQKQSDNHIWDFVPPTKPLVVAHRGASSLAPENTMAAVTAALDLGVDLVEIDVHRSKDWQLVVLHDSTVNRTSSGRGKVKNLTLAELQELDAGSWFGDQFKGERIPTLLEVLESVRDKAVLLIELKGKDTALPSVQLVRELDMSDQVIFQSFDLQQIQLAKFLAPDIPTLLLVRDLNNTADLEKGVTRILDKAQSGGANGIAIRYNWFSPELLSAAAKRNMAVFVWTVDHHYRLKQFIQSGVHGIITNKPQNLLPLLP